MFFKCRRESVLTIHTPYCKHTLIKHIDDDQKVADPWREFLRWYDHTEDDKNHFIFDDKDFYLRYTKKEILQYYISVD